jgi:methionine-rich copper-binding protein CopC
VLRHRVAGSVLFAAITISSEAFAHANLEKAVPPAGGTVTTSPSEIALTFSEGIEPKLSGIVLSDAAGNKMATGQPRIDPKNNAELIVPVTQPLSPSVYTVKWHVVSADSHKTQGTFTFMLKP